jgi:DNA-binding transcriptional LysR family regulator
VTIKELSVFYRLSEGISISQLAKELGVTQSALSLSLKSLETKLGVKLFDRIAKRLVLNDRGKEFKNQTYEHYLSLKDAQNLFVEDRVSGELNIALSKTLGEFVAPQTIYNFLVKYPLAKIKSDIKNSRTIIEMVKNGKIDIGFIESDCEEKSIIKEKIGSDSLEIVCSDKSLEKNSYYIDELFKKRWILREKGSGTREIFLDTIGALSKEIDIFMEFKEFEEAKTLLCANPETITCISRYVVKKELEKGELYRVRLKNLEIKRDFFMIYHKNRYRSKLFREFEAQFKNI